MFDNIWEWASKVLGGIGATGVFAWFINRRKVNAEARRIDADAELVSTNAKHIRFGELESIIGHMRKELDRLSERVTQAEMSAASANAKADECEKREAKLIERIKQLELGTSFKLPE